MEQIILTITIIGIAITTLYLVLKLVNSIEPVKKIDNSWVLFHFCKDKHWQRLRKIKDSDELIKYHRLRLTNGVDASYHKRHKKWLGKNES